MSTHICPNCSNEFTGQFCNNCGQKVVHRITMPHLWHDLFHAFTHADKGFLYLFLQLFKRPGAVARDYIVEGKRKRYFTPLQYLIIIGAITTFIIATSHFMEAAMRSMDTMNGSNGIYTPKQQDFLNKISAFQNKYFNIVLIIQLPFFAFASFLIYKNKKYNYAEVLTLHTFVTAQTAILGLLVLIIMSLFKFDIFQMAVVSMVISLVYQAVTYTVFFQEKSIKGVLKASLAYLLGFTFYMALIFATLILVVILFYS